MPLRPDTQAVWDVLQTSPMLRGFCLIGGTALTLRIDHRVSEDLDFAFVHPRGQKGDLPVTRLKQALLTAQMQGLEFKKVVDMDAFYNWQNDGLNLDLSQQNFVVNDAVKVTFFVPDMELQALLGAYRDCEIPEVVSVRDAFRSKCIVCADRSKTRDWLDLYVLLTQHGFTAQDFIDAYRDSRADYKIDLGLARLASGKPDPLDEGYDTLMADPPSLETLTDYFKGFRDEVERTAVRKALSDRTPRSEGC